MGNDAFSDKRKFSRADVAALVIIGCNILVSINNKENREFHVHTESISEGGISVILDEELPSLAVARVRLYLTGKVAPIECKGKVAWSRVISPEGVKPILFLTGIELVDLDNDAREHISKIVSCFLDSNS